MDNSLWQYNAQRTSVRIKQALSFSIMVTDKVYDESYYKETDNIV